jgi:hypothetical protein
MELRGNIVIISGGIKRPLNDEEWELVKPHLENGEIMVTSHLDEMKNKFDELDFLKEIYSEEFLLTSDDNHYWKKSNKRKHPAFYK